MAQGGPSPQRPIGLATILTGVVAFVGFVSWGALGGRNPVDLLVMIGYAVFLGWFGTGVALAVRHPAFGWFQVSALAQPALLAAFGIGWALNPEAMFESWPLVCVLLALSLGTCALIGFLTAAIGWWVWFHSPSAGRSM